MLSNVMARLGTSPPNVDLIKLTSDDYKSVNALPPSEFAKTSQYTEILQPTKVGTALYMINRPVDPNRVPIALLSEIFAYFEVNFHEGREETYERPVFEATRELMYGLVSLPDSEAKLQKFVNEWLTKYFDVTLETQIAQQTKRSSDGHHAIETSHGDFLTLVTEGKLSFGSGSGEPTIQGMSYYREFYRQRAKDLQQYGGCKPALLLVYAGTLPCHCLTRIHILTLHRSCDRCIRSCHAQGWDGADGTVNVDHGDGLRLDQPKT
jgi:hypothetical protein